jgi:diguanylate cyclase (GGDEF)-like protein
MRTLLLTMGLLGAGGVHAADAALPLTVDERNAACVEAEDADPARSIALADSVLSETASLSSAQRAEALGCRGWAQASLERREEARRDAYALRDLVRAFPVSAERVRMTRRVGGILHRSGDRVGAVDLYADAVADAEAQGLEGERIPLLVNLGVLHSEFEEHERARVNYEQALALMQRLQDFRYEAPVRFNLGLNLVGQQRQVEAIPHFRRALELVEGSGMGGPAQATSIRVALADALVETGEAEESRRLLDEVRQQPPPSDSATVAQLRLIESAQLAAAGRDAEALAVLAPLAPDGLQDLQRWQLLRRRATLLERLGREAEALAALREVIALRETYLRNQNHERLAALEAHLRDREQRQQLERLQADAEQQVLRLAENARLQWIGVIVAALLLLFGLVALAQQRRMNRRLDRAARTDPLTGLANRRDMAERLRVLVAASNGHAALMLVDIDLFKRINDEHGHDIGDEVLVAFARRLATQAGAGALVARWGGEEFLVVRPQCRAEEAFVLAETLRRELARPVDTRVGAVGAQVSIGVANLPLPGARGADAWHASLQLADSALYLAKHSGRDAWAGYWIEHPIPDWPPERLGRESQRARTLGLIVPRGSRALDQTASRETA